MTKTNHLLLGFGLFAAACGTNDDSTDRLPSASLTPHTRSLTAAVACGDDIALYGAATPDLRYTFTYNSDGYMTHADGVYTAGGANDTIDYSFDSAQRFTHMLQTHGWGDSRTEIGETYDGDNLATYSYATASADYTSNVLYTYSDFLGPWQPQHEEIADQQYGNAGYALAYDSFGRLITATPDSGDATTYTYDDAAGTITSDTGNGKWVYTTTYRSDWAELSEVWGGSDPYAVAGDFTLTWDGDSLIQETYRSGSYEAPTDVQLIETDTMRFDCSNARKVQGHMFNARAPRQASK